MCDINRWGIGCSFQRYQTHVHMLKIVEDIANCVHNARSRSAVPGQKWCTRWTSILSCVDLAWNDPAVSHVWTWIICRTYLNNFSENWFEPIWIRVNKKSCAISHWARKMVHRCNLCDQVYASASALQNHKASTYGTEYSNFCSKCDKTFLSIIASDPSQRDLIGDEGVRSKIRNFVSKSTPPTGFWRAHSFHRRQITQYQINLH